MLRSHDQPALRQSLGNQVCWVDPGTIVPTRGVGGPIWVPKGPGSGAGCSIGGCLTGLAVPLMLCLCGWVCIAGSFNSFATWIHNLRTHNGEGMSYLQERQDIEHTKQIILAVGGFVSIVLLLLLVAVAVVAGNICPDAARLEPLGRDARSVLVVIRIPRGKRSTDATRSSPQFAAPYDPTLQTT